jgi:hypothetical protein
MTASIAFAAVFLALSGYLLVRRASRAKLRPLLRRAR